MTVHTTTPIRELLDATVRGQIIERGDPAYDEAAPVYNAMIDRRPELLVRCADVADVISCVNAARETGIDLAVRGGGHNGAGLGTVDDGLVADLSAMRGVRVDIERDTVRVQGGSTWGDVDHATHPFGRAVPSGIISTTGVGGLTLGGGTGHLTRKYGLTIDSLISADLVLADGTRVTVDSDHHPDLFWAIRGGGGNFGVVTSFEYRMHPVDTVVGGPMLWPLARSGELLSWYREGSLEAPEELTGFFAFLTVPPAPPFPEELHLHEMCGIVWCWTGDPADADAALAPARALAPALDGVHAMPYPMLQQAFDALYPPGDQWYWRADFVTEIPDEAVEQHVAHATMPTMQSLMHLYPVDGACHRVDADATAFSYRDANWNMVIAGVDHDPAKAGLVRDWAIGYHEDVHPFSTGGAYVNFLGEGEGRDRVRSSYRDNFDRLAKVKAEYDPGNLFHVNQNIPPAT